MRTPHPCGCGSTKFLDFLHSRYGNDQKNVSSGSCFGWFCSVYAKLWFYAKREDLNLLWGVLCSVFRSGFKLFLSSGSVSDQGQVKDGEFRVAADLKGGKPQESTRIRV